MMDTDHAAGHDRHDDDDNHDDNGDNNDYDHKTKGWTTDPASL